jgi:dipeptidase
MRISKKSLAACVISALIGCVPMVSMACSTILAGKDTTVDGSYIVARAVDSSDGTENVQFIIHPAAHNQTGNFKAYDRAGFQMALPSEALAYTSCPDLGTEEKGYGYAEVGFNSAGVAQSSTETIYSSDKALAVDPYVEDSGITENEMLDAVLPYIHSAKEGAAYLGNMIEKMGAGEGFGAAFMDKDGIWYLENASGHRWMAVKLPDDKVFVSANEGRLKDFDPTDTEHYMASSDLVSFAEKNGLYDPKTGPFDFHKAYFEERENDKTYNWPRVWRMQHLLDPSMTTTVEDSPTAPVMITPAKKLSIEDIKAIQRDHYNGTSHDPYANENPKEPYRPISVMRCEEVHILQVRPDLPQEIGCINYMEYGMADLGLFLPFYQGIESVPAAYRAGEDNLNENYASWIYRKPQALAMTNYNKYAPIVKKTYADYEAKVAEKQAEMEKQYLAIYKEKPEEAKALLQKFENEVLEGGLQTARDLTHTLEVEILKDTESTYHFHGA